MSKKATTTQPAMMSPRRARIINIVFIGSIVAILAGVGVWHMIRQHQLNKEHQKFLTAQADLHTLAQQIADAVGKPDQQKAVQSCRYQSEKYGRGARYCSVDEFSVYFVRDQAEAQQKTRVLTSPLSRSKDISNFQLRTSDLLAGELASTSFDLNDMPWLNQCGSSYMFLDKGGHAYYHAAFNVTAKQPMLIAEYGCSAFAKAEHFTVEN